MHMLHVSIHVVIGAQHTNFKDAWHTNTPSHAHANNPQRREFEGNRKAKRKLCKKCECKSCSAQ
jgi:hypothetical protein